MKIAVASDHAGFRLKQKIMEWLRARGHEVLDMGTASEQSCDYPDFGAAGAREVQEGQAERAVLICGSGIGMAMAANRFPAVRAAVARSAEDAEMARRHNDCNVLALGERFTQETDAERILDRWLATEFEGGRHALRVDKLGSLR
jgi:ribose 5-phosphate isomerase B